MKNKPFNLFLLGDPASGKSTHARYLAERYGLEIVDIGELLRKMPPESRRKYGVDVNQDRGAISPTAAAKMVMLKKLEQVPSSKGLLFAGGPKMIGEVKLAVKELAPRQHPGLYIYLTISEEEIHRRVRQRAKAENRKDDTVAAVRERLRYYRTHIARVNEYLKSQFQNGRISSEGSQRVVNQRLVSFIEKHI